MEHFFYNSYSIHKYLPTERGRRYKKNLQIMHQWANEMVERGKQNQRTGKALVCLLKRQLFTFKVSILCNAQTEDGEMLSAKQIRDECLTFVVGGTIDMKPKLKLLKGHETTSASLSWTFYLLAKYPHVHSKLREELNRILGDRQDVTNEDLDKMKYLNNVIKESLRLYPPAYGVFRFKFYFLLTIRETTRDINIGEYQLLAGSFVVVDIWSIHHNPEIYANPKEFIPERWENESTKPFSFLPFGMGQRNCIGQVSKKKQ
jgi:cytochrome P450